MAFHCLWVVNMNIVVIQEIKQCHRNVTDPDVTLTDACSKHTLLARALNNKCSYVYKTLKETFY